MAEQPKGMARAALERERQATHTGLEQAPPALQQVLQELPLGDGRVRLVVRRTGECVGMAVNGRVAAETRRFFA